MTKNGLLNEQYILPTQKKKKKKKEIEIHCPHRKHIMINYIYVLVDSFRGMISTKEIMKVQLNYSSIIKSKTTAN
jgi:hypothetical protein